MAGQLPVGPTGTGAAATAAPRCTRGANAEPGRGFASLLQESAPAGAPASGLPGDAPLAPVASAPQTLLQPLRRVTVTDELDEPWTPLGLEVSLILGPMPSAAPAIATAAPPAVDGPAPVAVLQGNAKPLPTAASPVSSSDDAAALLIAGSAFAPQAAAAGEVPQAADAPAATATATLAQATPAAPVATAMAAPLPRQWVELMESASPRESEGVQGPATSANVAAPLGLAKTSVVIPPDAPAADISGEGFDEAVGTKLVWMAEQKIGHAQIRIHPQALGPVEIRLQLDGDRVHAEFSSNQPEVRQALENSVPRLREMLASGGFELAQADVGQHRGQDRQPSSSERANATTPGGEPETDPGTIRPTVLSTRVRQLLDAYA